MDLGRKLIVAAPAVANRCPDQHALDEYADHDAQDDDDLKQVEPCGGVVGSRIEGCLRRWSTTCRENQ